jgi:hypothetical protein
MQVSPPDSFPLTKERVLVLLQKPLLALPEKVSLNLFLMQRGPDVRVLDNVRARRELCVQEPLSFQRFYSNQYFQKLKSGRGN